MKDRKILKVMSFNIRSCFTMKGTFDPSLPGKTIAAAAPDVCGIQEIRRGGSFDDCPAILGNCAGMSAEFGAALDLESKAGPCKYGIAALCRSKYEKVDVIRLPHSHVGFYFDSCLRMAAHFTKGETGLPKLSDITQNGNTVSAKILDPGKGVEYAELCYTDSKEKVYHKRVWKSIPAKIEKDVITAELPAGAHQFFLSAYEKKTRYNDLCGSTSPVILPVPGPGK